VGDPELGIELGPDEDRPQPRQHEPVDRAGVRVALDDHLVPELGEREADGLVSLGGPVAEEPRPLGAPGVGGELLGLLERGRRRADVDAVDDHRHVEREGAPAQRRVQLAVGAGAALVPRDVEAPRVAPGVALERL
jgi:hypothetical protein